jgi:hypothetical protein
MFEVTKHRAEENNFLRKLVDTCRQQFSVESKRSANIVALGLLGIGSLVFLVSLFLGAAVSANIFVGFIVAATIVKVFSKFELTSLHWGNYSFEDGLTCLFLQYCRVDDADGVIARRILAQCLVEREWKGEYHYIFLTLQGGLRNYSKGNHLDISLVSMLQSLPDFSLNELKILVWEKGLGLWNREEMVACVALTQSSMVEQDAASHAEAMQVLRDACHGLVWEDYQSELDLLLAAASDQERLATVSSVKSRSAGTRNARKGLKQ